MAVGYCVQSRVTSCTSAVDHHSVRSERCIDVGDRRFLLFTVHHKPGFTAALEQSLSGTSCRQRTEYSDQSPFPRAAILPLEPVTNAKTGLRAVERIINRDMATPEEVNNFPFSPLTKSQIVNPRGSTCNRRPFCSNLTAATGDTCKGSFATDAARRCGLALMGACAPVANRKQVCPNPNRNRRTRVETKPQQQLQIRLSGWGATSCSRRLLMEAWASCIARGTQA